MMRLAKFKIRILMFSFGMCEDTIYFTKFLAITPFSQFSVRKVGSMSGDTPSRTVDERAYGTPPTGMLSCLEIILQFSKFCHFRDT